MYKCKKILKHISPFIFIAGFVIILGAVGAMEMETISMGTGVLRSIGGMVLMAIGGKLS